MKHTAYFTDVFTIHGVTFEFFYTKLNGNCWKVRTLMECQNTGFQIYTATDDNPESLEALIATHRNHVADILASWATALKPKGHCND